MMKIGELFERVEIENFEIYWRTRNRQLSAEKNCSQTDGARQEEQQLTEELRLVEHGSGL